MGSTMSGLLQVTTVLVTGLFFCGECS